MATWSALLGGGYKPVALITVHEQGYLRGLHSKRELQKVQGEGVWYCTHLPALWREKSRPHPMADIANARPDRRRHWVLLAEFPLDDA